MHVITQDGILWRTLACPIPPAQRHRIQGVRLAGPDPLPAARLTVQRKVSSRGGIQVARQRTQVGISHAGQTVTVELGDTTVQVIDQHGELITIVPRNSTGEITRFKATAADAGPRQCSTRQRSASCMRPPGSGTRSAAQSHAINPATFGGHPATMAGVEEVEVVVAHNERATLRVGDVFLKIDADQARTDVEVEAMAMAPIPTPEILWRKPPVLALAALPGTALGRLGEPSTASSAAWAAAGAAARMLHNAPPPWAGQNLDAIAAELDGECEWLVTNGVLPTGMVTRNRRIAEAALRPWTPVFTHGDLQVDHVFVDGDKITGVVDWSEACRGDALYDLAVLTLGHQEHLGDVVTGYGTDVDLDVIRAWWSLRSLCGVRWLVEHGFDPFTPGCEVDVLRSRM